MKDSDPIYVYSTNDFLKTPQQIQQVPSFVQSNGIILIFLDSLPYWWNVKSENDNAEVTRALKPLLNLARTTGAAVGFSHHESKFGGRDPLSGQNRGDGKSIRGAGALFGLVDQALLLDRRHGGTRNQRVLKAIGRHSESPPELYIELIGNPELSDPNPYGYHVLGTADDLIREANKETVFNALTDKLQSIDGLHNKLGLSLLNNLTKKAIREAAEELCKEGKAIREGKGVKNDPYTYRLDPNAP